MKALARGIGRTIALSVILALGIRTFVAEARWIPSESMVPTLQKYDKLIVDKLSHTNPQRTLWFSYRQHQEGKSLKDTFIKRVIRLPGKVEVKGGRVYINDLRENYIEAVPQYKYGPVTVPPDSYLVLGDNRNNSYDSHFGALSHMITSLRAIVRFWPPHRVGELD